MGQDYRRDETPELITGDADISPPSGGHVSACIAGSKMAIKELGFGLRQVRKELQTIPDSESNRKLHGHFRSMGRIWIRLETVGKDEQWFLLCE